MIHAKYSASGSSRWLNCAGSVALSEEAPERPSSKYAEEGTNAHFCFEQFNLDPANSFEVWERLSGGGFPDDMIKHANEAHKWVMGRTHGGCELKVETRVDLDFVGEDMFGTVDAAIVEEFGTLSVIDFKYGAGVAVDPEENTQLIYYALGIANLYDYNFKGVELVIIQPRAHHSGGPIRIATMGIKELKAWETTFKLGIEKCEDPLAGYNAGAWCRWCPASVFCPAVSEQALETAKADFSPDLLTTTERVFTLPKITDPNSLGRALEVFPHLETWIKASKEYAYDMLNAGGKIPGWKLVPKRSTRKWEDEDETWEAALGLVGDSAFDVKLKSPAQLEKVEGISKDWVSSRCSNVSSGFTLAPSTDSRPAVNQLTQDFGPANEKEKKMIEEVTSPKKQKRVAKKKVAAKKAKPLGIKKKSKVTKKKAAKKKKAVR